jgi:hypothetical protein
MSELISEPITPESASADSARMARGEPGLPKAFTWRGDAYGVRCELAAWKESSREGARAVGDLYLRRHYYRLHMTDGHVWTVYFIRQSPRSGNPKNRWFLYTIDRSHPEPPE